MGIERSALYQYVASLIPRFVSVLELTLIRFSVCGSYSHAKCAGYLQGGCSTAGHGQAQDDTLTIISQSPVMFGNDLVRRVSRFVHSRLVANTLALFPRPLKSELKVAKYLSSSPSVSPLSRLTVRRPSPSLSAALAHPPSSTPQG